MARATEIDKAAFDVITREVFFVFLILMARARNQVMLGDLTHLTAA
jgi:hypothetical protein